MNGYVHIYMLLTFLIWLQTRWTDLNTSICDEVCLVCYDDFFDFLDLANLIYKSY
jgi:hypothetical protein